MPRSSDRRTCWVSWSCMAPSCALRRSRACPPAVPSGGHRRFRPWAPAAKGSFERRQCPARTSAPMPRATAFLLALTVLSCKRSEDQAAKQRIFSPEEPVGALAEAKEALDSTRLADDPKLAERVVRMRQAEVAARISAHKAQTRVQFAWFRGPGAPDGGSDVSLAEETTLLQA